MQLPTPSALLLITADIEGFDRREECVQLGGTSVGEVLRVQLRLRVDPSQYTTTHSVPRPTAVGGDPRSLTVLDFVGVYRDPGGALYYVSYSERPDALALELPTGAIIYFRKRDGLTFRSPQGVLTFRLQNRRLAGFSYAPNTIRADWMSLDR